MSHEHTDSSSCGPHDHGPSTHVRRWKIAAAVALTMLFVIGEVMAGLFSHSLALLSDAGHNFADAAALGLSWYALSIATKPSNAGMTYGYHRVGILAALVNAVSLVVIALLIGWEAIARVQHPEPVHGWTMVITAAIAIIVNVVISMWLHHGAKHDLNVRSAYIHMIGDAVAAFGVVIAGVVVLITGAHVADPIVSFLIAGLIVWSSWDILKESVSVLLEATPRDMDMSKVESTIRSVAGVRDLHDLHVWTVGPGAIAASVHILVAEQTVREGQQILRAVIEELRRHHRINHTTVQIEVEGHGADKMYCAIQPPADALHIGHAH